MKAYRYNLNARSILTRDKQLSSANRVKATTQKELKFKKEKIMNMSYCRFENTSKDLADCLDAIENNKHLDLGREEKNGLEWILGLCEEILDKREEIEEAIYSDN